MLLVISTLGYFYSPLKLLQTPNLWNSLQIALTSVEMSHCDT